MKRFPMTYLRYYFCALLAGVLLSQTVISAQETQDIIISNFIITELLNSSDSLGVFHNSFELPAELPEEILSVFFAQNTKEWETY